MMYPRERLGQVGYLVQFDVMMNLPDYMHRRNGTMG